MRIQQRRSEHLKPQTLMCFIGEVAENGRELTFILCGVQKAMRDRRLPPRFNWILPSSGLLCGARWFETDVSELPIARRVNNPEDGRIQKASLTLFSHTQATASWASSAVHSCSRHGIAVAKFYPLHKHLLWRTFIASFTVDVSETDRKRHAVRAQRFPLTSSPLYSQQ